MSKEKNIKILHVLASNKFSGAENVVCQIIQMFNDEIKMAYCSPIGPIEQSLKEREIQYFGIEKLNKKNLKKIIDDFKPTIIHAHDTTASVIASKFSKNYKIISHVHGNDRKNMTKLSLKSLIYKFVAKKFSHIYWVSKSAFYDYIYKKDVFNKSEILHNIINIEQVIEKAKADVNKYNYDVCMLGRLAEPKDPIRAINIFKSLIEKNNQIKIAIVGDGDYRSKCESLVKEYKLQNNISFLGFMNNPYGVLCRSKVLFMSSLYEGTPMVVLEAFVLGIPLVSTKVDGAVELLNNDLMGYLYETDDEAVEYLLKIINEKNTDRKTYLQEFSKEYNNISKYKEKLLKNYKK